MGCLYIIDGEERDAAFWTQLKAFPCGKGEKSFSGQTNHLCAGEQGDEKHMGNAWKHFCTIHITKISAYNLSVALRSDYTERQGLLHDLQKILEFLVGCKILSGNHESEP